MNEYQNASGETQNTAAGCGHLCAGDHACDPEKSDSDPIFNNPGIDARNQRIQQLADGVRVFYIDVNEVVCDDQGGLKQELTLTICICTGRNTTSG